MSQPVFDLKVNGTSYNWRAALVKFTGATLYRKDGFADLSWMRPPGALPGATDPFEGQAIELWIDAGRGLGSVLQFSGTCQGTDHAYTDFGWGQTYQALGKRWVGDLVPHTDAITGIDASPFNLPGDDPDSMFYAGRLGRTAGQILMAVLDMPANRIALTALGIGGYVSAGYGAGVTAVIGSGAVTGFNIVSAGAGYTTGATVLLTGGDGGGATATVSSVDGTGGITALTVGSGGSGYTVAPEVIVTNLPLATARDLAQMAHLIPFPVTVQGEKLLEAIEGELRRLAPNHFLHVRPDGVLRFLDLRTFAGPVAIFSGGGGAGAAVVLTVASGAVSGFSGLVGGSGYTSAPSVLIVSSTGSGATATASLTADAVTGFTITAGGSGYTGALTLTLDTLDAYGRCLETQAMTWRRALEHCFSRAVGRGQPRTDAAWIALSGAPSVGSGASATAVLTGGGVSSITGGGGTGYTVAPFVTITGGGGSGAEFTASVAGGTVSGYTQVHSGSGYATAPIVSLNSGSNGLTESFAHDGLTNAGAKDLWNWNQFTVPDGSQGQARISATVSGAGVITGLTIVYGGYGYASVPGAHFVPISGGSGASATLTITSGVVTGFTGLSGGTGYAAGVNVFVDMPGGPGGDSGTCTCPSFTTVTVKSSDPYKTWASNYWDQSTSGRKGVIFLVYPASTGLDTRIEARIISHGALTAGGTCTLTLDITMPANNYRAYKITGLTGGASKVWRDYQATDSALWQHWAPRFTYPKGVPNSDGSAASVVSVPFVRGLYSSNGVAPFYEIPIPASFDATTGKILTDIPTVRYFGTLSNLIQGGSFTDGILSDLQAYCAVYKQALTATYPPDVSGSPVYGGTSNTVRGLARTLTITIPGWRDPGQAAGVLAYVKEIWDTVKDLGYDVTVAIIGLYEEAFTPGVAVNITGPTYSTGLDSLNLPCVECSIKFVDDGTKYRTILKLSNRRAQYTAEQFVGPAPVGTISGGEISMGDYQASGMLGAARQDSAVAAMSGSSASTVGAMSGTANDAVGTMSNSNAAAVGAMSGGGEASMSTMDSESSLNALGGY